jgi:MYND finger
LDLWLQTRSNPMDSTIARQYAQSCWSRINAINVIGIFEAADFSVARTQAVLQFALRSRNPVRKGSKQHCFPGQENRSMTSSFHLQPGQRRIRHLLQDNRGEDGSNPKHSPFFVHLLEVVNIKPDEDRLALCTGCGTPHGLKKCSGCHTARYCSRNCQKSDWKIHKKECKQDKLLYEEYQNELTGKAQIPNDYLNGERICHQKYDRNNMRFTKGTKVECILGEQLYGTGKVVEVLHEWEGLTHPYQVQLDWKTAHKMDMPYHMAQIWADWDCDYMIRKI